MDIQWATHVLPLTTGEHAQSLEWLEDARGKVVAAYETIAETEATTPRGAELTAHRTAEVGKALLDAFDAAIEEAEPAP